jgi:EmrB/QacA subfamily drug resistance transporter
VLGGLLTDEVSWRWVFYVNVPIGIAAFIFGALFLDPHEQPDPGRLDVVGFVLSGLGLGGVMYGVSEGPIKGWSTTPVLVTVIVGAVLLAAMLVYELRATNPLIDLRLFTDRLFAPTTAVLVLASVAFLGVLYLAALFFQDALRLTALQAGLLIFPEAVGVMIGSQVVSRFLYPRLGPSRTMAAGLVGVAASIGLLGLVSGHTDLWLIRGLMLLLGYFMSHCFIPAQAAAFATISPDRTGRASSIFNAGRQLGGAVGVAALTTVLASLGPDHIVGGHEVANLRSYHVAFIAAAGVAILAGALALRVNDALAASTRGAGRQEPVPDPA